MEDPKDLETTSELMVAAVSASPTCLLWGIASATLVAAFAQSVSVDVATCIQFAIWSWWVAITLTFGVAYVMTKRFNAEPRSPARIVSVVHSRGWWVVVGACALSSGSTSWLMLPSADRSAEMVVIAFMIALTAVHGGSQASYPPLMLRWLLPATVIFVAGLWRLGDLFHVLVGVGFVILSVVIYFYTRAQAHQARRVMTLRNDAQAARAEAEKSKLEAEKANQDKTTFLVVVGHELRQPMHALVLYYGRLDRETESGNLKSTVNGLGVSLDAMRDLLNSILDVSRLLTGGVEARVVPVSLAAILESMKSEMLVHADERRHSFELACVGDIWIETDGALLQRVLRNLILNAFRYTEDGGVIGVRVTARGQKAIIRVYDSGPGIERGEREKVFEHFYRAAKTSNSSKAGFGLGLAIVRQLTDILGIEVSLRSKVGKGSIFRLSMDTAPHSARPTADTVADHRDYVRGSTILLIDDHVEAREATADALRDFGCNVISVASASEAEPKLSDLRPLPHMIISDYRLDEDNGINAVFVVRKRINSMLGDDFHVSALILSGDTALEVLEKVRDAGFPLLHKPVSRSTLYATVNRELRRLALGLI